MKKELFVCLVLIFSFLFVQHLIAVHNPGKDCFACHGHGNYKIGGTVFTDSTGADIKSGVSCSFIKPDGSTITLSGSNNDGNIVSSTVPPDGTYRITVAGKTSRTWHILPDQKSCNKCHIVGGNGTPERNKVFHKSHTAIPSDNKCTHCHYFPTSMSLNNLRTPRVLDGSHQVKWFKESPVLIEGKAYWIIDPNEYNISAKRQDIFNDGFYSMFDVILAVAEKYNIPVEYYYDDSCKTHFITKINNIEGDYWYHFTYGYNENAIEETTYKRANRWDEALWVPGAAVAVVKGDNLEEIKQEFRDEIRRENDSGHIIPIVRFAFNPSNYKDNPDNSGRIYISKNFYNVLVTPHNMRSYGYPSHYSKPFKPGVVTSIDILYSLFDQDSLNTVTGAFFDNIDSYNIVELGFPQEGTAHASGWQGFAYITENGTFNNLPNDADTNQYMPCDLNVVHAQDFSYWKWVESGNPYFEISDPTTDVLDEQISEDYQSIGRGFNLHNPYPNPFSNSLRIRFNVFEADYFNLSLYNLNGEKIATVFSEYVSDIGVKELSWDAVKLTNGQYFLVLKNSKNIQEKSVVYIRE